MSASPRLQILFDNYPGQPGLTTLWGGAALIQAANRTILFDTGNNGRVLLKNTIALGVAPETLDAVFLSHPHWDRLGGLDSILEAGPRVTVILHAGFAKHLSRDLRSLCRELIVVESEPVAIAPGLFAPGTLDSEPPEHALVLEWGGTTAALAGCAHPGMERIVARAAALLGRLSDWASGGFHLMDADADKIAASIGALQALDAAYVVPTHCTGDAARGAFRQAYGDRCLAGGVGRTIALVPRAASVA